MLQIPKLISKTKIMQGYQCKKNIYLSVHKKELIPKVTPELQALFDQGNEVTIEARKKYPEGVLVDNAAYDFVGSLKKTRELLALETKFIFEAAFEYKGCYARADIISYNPLTQRWSVLEVKSSTKVKDEHLDDVGLQVWIMANAGLPIEKISILHLNNLCQYPNLSNLFTEVDVTDELRQRHLTISPKLTEIFKSLKEEVVPVVDIGAHCSVPHECQFITHCFAQKNIPETSIFDIPGFYTKKWDLYNQGIININDVRDEDLTDKQKICVDVLKTNKRYINSEIIKETLSAWQFPLVFLDFETISPAIPKFDKTGPFSQVTFQFSVHILNSIFDEPSHFEFLHTDLTDPRNNLVTELIKACGRKGSVVAYFGKFEAARIQELEDYFPEHKSELLQIRERIVDPLPLFREAVYDAQFKDSYSIKSVGPAILGNTFSYDDMNVGDGSAAQRAFAQLTNKNVSPARKNELIFSLLEYCKKDTLVMVELVKWLFTVSK